MNKTFIFCGFAALVLAAAIWRFSYTLEESNLLPTKTCNDLKSVGENCDIKRQIIFKSHGNIIKNIILTASLENSMPTSFDDPNFQSVLQASRNILMEMPTEIDKDFWGNKILMHIDAENKIGEITSLGKDNAIGGKGIDKDLQETFSLK